MKMLPAREVRLRWWSVPVQNFLAAVRRRSNHSNATPAFSSRGAAHDEIRHVGEIGGEWREQRGLRRAGLDLKVILQREALGGVVGGNFPGEDVPSRFMSTDCQRSAWLTCR